MHVKLKPKTAEEFFEVKKRRGIWEVWKDGLICWEDEGRLSAIEQARKFAAQEGAGIRVMAASGRIWWEEEAARLMKVG